MAQPDEKPTREQWAVKTDSSRTDFARAESPLKYQIGAWVLWVAGFAVALAGVMCAAGALDVPVLTDLPVLSVVLAVVVDLAAVLVAQRLWKKAGALARGKKQGPLGVAMACLAFAPMCLFFLAAKNAPSATKTAAVVAALVSVTVIAAATLALNALPPATA